MLVLSRQAATPLVRMRRVELGGKHAGTFQAGCHCASAHALGGARGEACWYTVMLAINRTPQG